MDCQFIMSLFVYVYYLTFIKTAPVDGTCLMCSYNVVILFETHFNDNNNNNKIEKENKKKRMLRVRTFIVIFVFVCLVEAVMSSILSLPLNEQKEILARLTQLLTEK